MTAIFPYRFVRRLLPPPAAVVAMASAATIGACAAAASPLAASTSYRPDDVVDTFDAAAPGAAPNPGAAQPPAVAPAAAPEVTPGVTPDAAAGTAGGTAAGTAPGVPANALSGPVSPDELARLLDEGETAYRARRHDEALAAFQRVVSLDPAQTQAWLRLGNLHHRRGKWFEALSAYRRVAARSSGDGVDASMRAKALYNLALINLELAQQSLRTLERIGPAAGAAGEREPLSAAVRSARRRLDAFGEAAPAPPPAARPEVRPDARVDARADARPEAPKRGAARPASGTQVELPRIDYFRGAPKP
ncbi:MAG: tetratricopeptide repeat protein [Burkholderiaceae bacterium]|nr:tetratricopeptide repeat protein [Burkholderiaceae bacterium]